jgi:hypothetical protein
MTWRAPAALHCDAAATAHGSPLLAGQVVSSARSEAWRAKMAAAARRTLGFLMMMIWQGYD